jgi:hypothetical protein
MSAFRDLLKQAHEKGETFIEFRVSLADFFADEQNESWGAYAVSGKRIDTGRTGEEALRRLVEGL